MHRHRLRAISIAVAASSGTLFGASLAAQASVNLVVNGTFASSLAGWSAGSGDVRSEWSPESARADGTGSARLTSENPSGGTAESVLNQCVLVTPGAHLLRLTARVPSGQPTTGGSRAIAYAYGNTICTGTPVSGGSSTPELMAAVWRSGWVAVNVPANGASVTIRLVVRKDQDGGEFDVLADDVELRTGLLFVDGFASGTTAQWSATVP